MSHRYSKHLLLLIASLLFSPLALGGSSAPSPTQTNGEGGKVSLIAQEYAYEQRTNGPQTQAPNVTVTEVPTSTTTSTTANPPLMNRMMVLPVHTTSDIANVNTTLSTPTPQVTVAIKPSVLTDTSAETQQNLDRMVQNAKQHSATPVRIAILSDSSLDNKKTLEAALQLAHRNNVVFESRPEYASVLLATHVNAMKFTKNNRVLISTRYLSQPRTDDATMILKAIPHVRFVTGTAKEIQFDIKPHQLITRTYNPTHHLLKQESVSTVGLSDAKVLEKITKVIGLAQQEDSKA